MAKDCHPDPALVESGGFRPGGEVLASASAANRALLATGVPPCRVLSTSSPTSFLVSLKSMTWAAEARNWVIAEDPIGAVGAGTLWLIEADDA